MKKILVFLLALVMCLGCFAGCAGKSNETAAPTGGATPDAAPTLAEAIEYLNSIYKDGAKQTQTDYDVVGKILIDDATFTVTWTVNNESIQIKVSEKNSAFYTVDLPAKNDTAVDYTLTATVTDAAGNSEQLSFERTLPVYDSSAVIDKPVEGTAYKLYLVHASLGQTLFANGATQNDKYLETTTDAKEAPDFYVEADGDGFKFYTTIDGKKMYVKASTQTKDNGDVSKYVAYSATEGTTWTYKAETNGWYTTINNLEYVLGTYGTYKTFCISDSKHLTATTTGVTQFPGGLILKETAEAMTPSEGPTIYKTAEEIVNAAYALEPGAILSGGHKYTLTGVITSIPTAWSESYGNITVVIVVNNMTDKPIECFRLSGNGADTLAVGDTITVTGEIINYASYDDDGNLKFTKVEFNAGCTLASDGDNGGADQTPVTLEAQTPAVGTAYKLGFVQGKLNKIYYLTGVMSSHWMGSTQTINDGANFYIEETTSGYYLYCMVNGAKKYVNMVVNGDYINAAFENDASTVYTYDATLKTLVGVVNNTNYIFGTSSSNTYTTLGPVKASDNPFYAVFVTSPNPEAGNTPDEGGEGDGEVTEPTLDAQTPVVGTAYKLGFIQGNLNKIYYLTGAMSSHWMGSTETFADGADFCIEETTGGYHLSCTVGGAKKYVNMVVNGNYINAAFEDAASTVYTYDETLKTLVGVVNETNYIFGTSSSGTYTTLGPEKASANPFYAVFVTEAGILPTPDEGEDDNENPATGDNIVLSVDTLGLASQSYAEGTATINGVDFEYIQMGNYGDGLQMRDKNGNTSSIWNTTAFSKGIARIDLVFSDTKSTYDNADAVIFTFGNAVGEATCTTKLSTSASTKTYTITPDADTYTFFKLEHDLGYTFYWKSITIVFADGTTATLA